MRSLARLSVRVALGNLSKELDQLRMKRCGIGHIRGMAAARDDHLSAVLHGTNQEIGLALGNKRVMLAPDGQDRDLDFWPPVVVLEGADRRHGRATVTS